MSEPDDPYRLLFDGNPLPTWVYDLETLRFLAVNDASVREYGYSREEFLSMTMKEIRPVEDLPRLAESVAPAANGFQHSNSWRHRKKNGTIIHVEIASHSHVFGGRRARLVVAHDVTERVLAREALERYVAEIDDLYNRAPCGYHSLNADGVLVRINDTELSWLGYRREDLLGRAKFEDFLPAEDRQRFRQLLKEALGRNAGSFECSLVCRDGHRLPVLLSTASHRDEGGRFVVTRSTLFDLSERRRLEDQLRESQKMEAIGRLAGGIAHDFNNVLTVINGYSELAIKRLPKDHPVAKDLIEVRYAGERAAELTRQLLDFSRRQVISPQVLDMNQVASDVERMLHRLIGENIHLETMLARETGRVKADPGQLEQVLVNLAVNARDAMPGGGTLTIETRNVTLDDSYSREHPSVSPGEYVLVAVSDTGTGMTAEIKSRAFEPFFTTKEAGKGTGLGLATVYEIVKQCGGDIWVYSEPGRGTTFNVYLPRVDEPVKPPEVSVSSGAIPLSGTETILFVEDEEAVRNLVVTSLDARGYTVMAFDHPSAAVDAASTHAGGIDLLLTDVSMPGMSGVALAERIRAGRPGLKVLFISGYSDEAVVSHGHLGSSAEFLPKPFTPVVLVRKVRAVLDS